MSQRWSAGNASLIVIACAIAIGGGCKKPVDVVEPPKAEQTTSVAKTTAVPKDHVEIGSLVPGKEKAYALVLPLGFGVTSRVDATYAATGIAQPKQVITYIKERVRDGKVTESDARTVFDGVRIPDEPDRYLQITVTPRSGATLITITDVTPVADLPPTSQTERYKQVGLDPQGHLLKPHTIE